MKNLQAVIEFVSHKFVFQKNIKEGYKSNASLKEQKEAYKNLFEESKNTLKQNIEKKSATEKTEQELTKLNEPFAEPFKSIKERECTFSGKKLISTQLANFFKEKGSWKNKEKHYATKKVMAYLTNEFGMNINDPKKLEGYTLWFNEDNKTLSIGRKDLKSMEMPEDEPDEELDFIDDDLDAEQEDIILPDSENNANAKTTSVKTIQISKPVDHFTKGIDKLKARNIPTEYSLKNKDAVDALLKSDIKKSLKARKGIKDLEKLKQIYERNPGNIKSVSIVKDRVHVRMKNNATIVTILKPENWAKDIPTSDEMIVHEY